MRKLALLMALVLLISVPVEAGVATWTLNATPQLDYSGTTAICQAKVYGNSASDHIVVNMKLMLGENLVTSWSESGYGYVYMKQTTPVGKGSTFTLVVDVTMNGVAQPSVSVEKTC